MTTTTTTNGRRRRNAKSNSNNRMRAAAAAGEEEEGGATYKESFDSSTGQMVKSLTQAIEQIEVNGQIWTQRRGRADPKNAAEKKENPVVFIHGLGSCAYTFRQVSVMLQEKGYETYAPDIVGHGDSEKGGGFKYDEQSYVNAMETYVEKIADGKQVDLVAQGYIIPQYAVLLARKRPDLFRRIVLMNMPLDGNHNLAGPLATYAQMFGMGKGKAFDAVSLNYMGNEFAIGGDDLKEYERAYVGGDAENARMAVEMTVTNADFKNLKKKVKDAYFQGGMPKTRIVWGVADKYLDQAPMFSWASDARASEKALRKVGHMPQEDFPQVTADAIDEFFTSDLKVGALKSVRGRKVTADDGQG
jgi:pimeloyl-ACP methyl ester carboxylesterase